MEFSAPLTSEEFVYVTFIKEASCLFKSSIGEKNILVDNFIRKFFYKLLFL